MGKLYGSLVYEAGPIERASDLGHGWRNWITPWLKERGIVPVNPLAKPLLEREESDEAMEERRELRRQGKYTELAKYRRIRNTDLRLVDLANWVIIYLNMQERPCGTLEELFQANQSKKPILVMVEGGYSQLPDWLWWTLPAEHIFANWNDLKKYIDDIDSGLKDHDRFVHFDFTKLTPIFPEIV